MGMDELIGIINDLHSALAEIQIKESELNLNLPRIAVVGSQSSGKSSVLEAFVGRDFLPRGAGIVTRCPLVLQLIQQPPGSAEWGEFGHRGDKYTDFVAIRDEITRRTSELAGNASVCETPIMLKIYSPNVLHLTVIDLPGLVNNATRGQPESIVQSIHNMVRSFVAPENTIILAISSAAEDIANSRALDMARSVDRDGNRTIGVLTKLDLMDPGTDAAPVLNNELINLKHGFIGVVNRSQKDINENTPMENARKREQQFFLSHPAYAPMAARMGTAYLAAKLNALLLVHIQSAIPKLRSHVDSLIKTTRAKQEQLGMLEQTTEPSSQLLTLLQKFSDGVKRSVQGDFSENTQDELRGGSRISYIFNECYTPFILGLKAAPMLTDDFIRNTVSNSTGLQSSLYPSDLVILRLIKQQIERLDDPSVRLVGFIHEELAKIIESSATAVDRFPLLHRKVMEIATELLMECRNPTADHILTTLQAERGLINVRHPVMQEVIGRLTGTQQPSTNNGPQVAQGGQQGQYGAPTAPQQQLGGVKGQPAQPQQQSPAAAPAAKNVPRPFGQPGYGPSAQVFTLPGQMRMTGVLNDRERREYDSIREMVEAYFNIVQRTTADQVPKVIALLMITKLTEEIYHKLLQRLFTAPIDPELLAESPAIAAQRKATLRMMKCLTKAQEVLNKVRDHHLARVS